MKGLLAILIFALVAVETSEMTENKETEECKIETGATNEKLQDGENPTAKCFYNCLLKKQGIIVDGKILLRKIITFFGNPNDSNNGKEAIQNVKNCVDKANQQTNCEVAFSYFKCMKERMIPVIGQTLPPD